MKINYSKSLPIKIKKIFVFILIIVLIMGCYHKLNVYDQSAASTQDENVNNVSKEKIQKFLSTIKKVDGDLEAKYKMALHFQKIKKHKIAVEVLHEVIQKEPMYIKAYNAMGVSYDHIGNHSRAIYAYKYALKLDPNFDYAQNNLGYAYLLNGNLDLAINAFQKAVSLNDSSKLYHNNLGLAYAENEQFDLALAQFSFDGDEIAANRKLGKLLYRKGKFELSKKYFAKATQLETSSANIAPLPTKKIIGRPSDSLKKDEEVTKSEFLGIVSDNDQQPSQNEKLLVSEYTPQHNEIQKNTVSDAHSFTTETLDSQLEDEEVTKSESLDIVSDNDQQPSQNEKLLVSEYTPQHNETQKNTVSDAHSFTTETLDSQLEDEEVTKSESLDIVSDNDQQPSQNEKLLVSKNSSSNSDKENTTSRTELETGTINSQKYSTEISKSSDQDEKKKEYLVKAESDYDIKKYSKKTTLIVTEDRNSNRFLVDAEIEVSNGNGVNRMAKRVGNYFEKNGLNVSRLTNAEHFNFNETKIFYLRPYLHDAYIVAQQIPGWQNMKAVDELCQQNIKIKVLIGKDLIPYHSLGDN